MILCELLGRSRVAMVGSQLRKFGVKRLRRPVRGPRPNFRADRFRDFGNIGKALRQGFEIEPGAADEDRQEVLRSEIAQCRFRVFEIAADGIIHCAIDMAEEEMRRQCQLFRLRPRGEDSEIAIDLHGIGIDDGAAETRGKPRGKC